ncbi:MAG TPA: nicotinate-nicotinamide nucleotide adenylyltransferase, partial [Fimbriimonadaceae bacterium]|nr:nicotinate-nicotinamide nucleotide adenylyltransferase [Fimbriimonadaceae bacterium]
KRRRQSSAEQRLKMCELAIEGHEGMAVSDIETSRGGDSYLVDTLRELKMVMPGEYWFILGADALATFNDWKEPKEVLNLCRLAVFQRPGTDLQTVLSRLDPETRERIDLVTADVKGLSSSNIRDMAVRGEDWSHTVAPAVYGYVKENNIFEKE